VERVLALLETDFVSSMQTAGDRADMISKFATLLGDPGLVNEQLDRYRRVTAEEVTAFARDFLGEDNRASLVYVPRTAEGTAEDSR
jgi:predicted Zn-dependent peptidase